LPTAITHELLRVVVSFAVGAPDAPLALTLAPMAPDPFVPVVSTPLNVTTPMDESTLCARLAVTETFVSAAVVNARQISEVPPLAFVRFTRVQVSPPPVTLVTVMFEDCPSVETNASSNSFGDAVDNGGLVIDEAGLPLLAYTLASIASADVVDDKTLSVTVIAAGEPCAPGAVTVT
jgi:hypothetical protein